MESSAGRFSRGFSRVVRVDRVHPETRFCCSSKSSELLHSGRASRPLYGVQVCRVHARAGHGVPPADRGPACTSVGRRRSRGRASHMEQFRRLRRVAIRETARACRRACRPDAAYAYLGDFRVSPPLAKLARPHIRTCDASHVRTSVRGHVEVNGDTSTRARSLPLACSLACPLACSEVGPLACPLRTSLPC